MSMSLIPFTIGSLSFIGLVLFVILIKIIAGTIWALSKDVLGRKDE